MLARLLEELGGEQDDLHVIRATQGAGLWSTAKSAWLSCPAGYTHQVVLQDDGWPCINFRGGLRATLALAPSEVVSYFLAGDSELACKLFANNQRWYINGIRGGGVCLALPRNMAVDFVSWADSNVAENYPHDDARLGIYCAEYSLPVYHTIPSLVEHLGRSSTWNTAANKRGPAGGMVFASLWLGEELDPETMDWSAGLERPQKLNITPTRAYGNRWRKTQPLRGDHGR
jgi:hypothetical protein